MQTVMLIRWVAEHTGFSNGRLDAILLIVVRGFLRVHSVSLFGGRNRRRLSFPIPDGHGERDVHRAKTSRQRKRSALGSDGTQTMKAEAAHTVAHDTLCTLDLSAWQAWWYTHAPAPSAIVGLVRAWPHGYEVCLSQSRMLLSSCGGGSSALARGRQAICQKHAVRPMCVILEKDWGKWSPGPGRWRENSSLGVCCLGRLNSAQGVVRERLTTARLNFTLRHLACRLYTLAGMTRKEVLRADSGEHSSPIIRCPSVHVRTASEYGLFNILRTSRSFPKT